MNEGLAAVTTATLGLALDAAVLRQQAIASNIANAGTQNYVPLHLNFAAQLEQIQAGLSTAGGVGSIREAGKQLQLEPMFDGNGYPAKVQLDVEMASMAQNNVLYQALIKGLNRHMTIQSMAANDGKR